MSYSFTVSHSEEMLCKTLVFYMLEASRFAQMVTVLALSFLSGSPRLVYRNCHQSWENMMHVFFLLTAAEIFPDEAFFIRCTKEKKKPQI